MARIAFWAALATSAALAAGCGPEKQLPDNIPKRVEQKDDEAPVPKVSEPAAKEYVAKAARALTGGKPELVDRAKVSRASFRGKVYLPVTGESGLVQFAAERTVVAVWPDRAQTTDDLTLEKRSERVQVWLRRPALSIRRGGTDFPHPSPVEGERVAACDVTAQYWLALGVPLADPNAVAFDLRAPADGPTRVRLALPDYPPFALTFDAKTDRLLRVEYQTTEQRRTRRKVWNLTATRPSADGGALPHTFEFRQDGVLAEEWTAEKWEFPASIPDAEFVPPPPKK
jgi:hypothetical protein